MTTTLRVLGCGSSGGVPRVGNDWGNCDPDNPKNRRERCSIMVQKTGVNGEKTTIIIDTGPDFRNQMNAANVNHLDAVFYTHAHADHIHGIDDLRAIAINTRKRVNVWADDFTAGVLESRFDYCFKTPNGSDYPPILTMNRLTPGNPETVNGAGGALTLTPFTVNHGRINSLGFRINNTVYIPDLDGVPEESLRFLDGLDTWIVDGLRRSPHPSHFSFADALEWIDRVKPKRAFITNMHVDLDYDWVDRNSPDNVKPCHDGLTFEI